MKNWDLADLKDLSHIQGVCLDIDDTLTTSGKLTSQAYAALWKLKKSGYAVIPITGRPAGWCDQIARFWPVDAVVGENGAFVFYMGNGIRQRVDTPGLHKDYKIRLKQLAESILKHFPQARWASDQAYRETDLAIDICEDVSPWTISEIHQLMDLCRSEGAHVKLSSIHVNAWFGEYDKLRGIEHALQFIPFQGKTLQLEQMLFIGDSPNDEPLFAQFPKSVGVANLNQYLKMLQHLPQWITRGRSGRGFVEMVQRLTQSRSSVKAAH